MNKFIVVFKAFLWSSILFLSQSGFKSIDASHVSAQGITPEMILRYVNEYRAQKHLPPLTMNVKISAEAAHHSIAMAKKSIPFGHSSFNTRIQHINHEIKDYKAGAENVAYYKTNAKKLVEAWISSPGHRRNILGNYNLTGIGIAYGKNGWAYYTQIFVRQDKPNSKV